MLDERGEIKRQPNGEAINIRPGEAIVFEADGSVTTLVDEYSQWVFNEAHDAATDGSTGDSGGHTDNTIQGL
jgi:hypothetical protein